MQNKNVTIREDQEKFVKEHCINVSRFLQKHIDEEMRTRGVEID
jgi:post-segregation antitoxin (ccd killing protein)